MPSTLFSAIVRAEFYRNIACSLQAFEFRTLSDLSFFTILTLQEVAETSPFKMSDYVSKDSTFFFLVFCKHTVYQKSIFFPKKKERRKNKQKKKKKKRKENNKKKKEIQVS